MEHVRGENPSTQPPELMKTLAETVILEAKKKSALFGGYGNAIYALTQGIEMAGELLVQGRVIHAEQLEDMMYEVSSKVKEEA